MSDEDDQVKPAEVTIDPERAHGSSDPDVQLKMLSQSMVLFRDTDDMQKEAKIVLKRLEAIAPRDQTEGMLASQMVATHDTAMHLLRRASLPEQTFAGKDMNLKHAYKMLQLYARQLEALGKYRNKGQQKITVERVNVEAGGQAIVGSVSTGQESKDGASPADEVEDKSLDDRIMPSLKSTKKPKKVSRELDE